MDAPGPVRVIITDVRSGSVRKQRPIAFLPLVSPQNANSLRSLPRAAHEDDDSPTRPEAALWSR